MFNLSKITLALSACDAVRLTRRPAAMKPAEFQQVALQDSPAMVQMNIVQPPPAGTNVEAPPTEEPQDKRNNPVRVTREEDEFTRTILDGLFKDTTCDWLHSFLEKISNTQGELIKNEVEGAAAIQKEKAELDKVIQSKDCKAMFFAFTEEAKGVRKITDAEPKDWLPIFDEQMLAIHNKIKSEEASQLWGHRKGRKQRNGHVTDTVENGGISENPIASMENIFTNLFNKPNSVDTPGMLQLVPAEDSVPVQAFRKCSVPWIGGVSGSILERILFLHQINPDMVSDKAVFGMMAAFELSGHHSLSEVAIVAKEAVEQLGSKNCAQIRGLVVPMDLKTMQCNDYDISRRSMKEAIGSVFGGDQDATTSTADNTPETSPRGQGGDQDATTSTADNTPETSPRGQLKSGTRSSHVHAHSCFSYVISLAGFLFRSIAMPVASSKVVAMS